MSYTAKEVTYFQGVFADYMLQNIDKGSALWAVISAIDGLGLSIKSRDVLITLIQSAASYESGVSGVGDKVAYSDGLAATFRDLALTDSKIDTVVKYLDASSKDVEAVAYEAIVEFKKSFLKDIKEGHIINHVGV